MKDKGNVSWLVYRQNKGARLRSLNVQSAVVAQLYRLPVADVRPIIERLDLAVLALPEDDSCDPMKVIDDAIGELEAMSEQMRARRDKR